VSIGQIVWIMGTLCIAFAGPVHKTYLRTRKILIFPVAAINVPFLQTNCIHCTQIRKYKEDYVKLGIPENATAEQIKSAYFLKAKEVHPDSSDEKDDARFIELTEAYNRLMYESKFGTGQIPDNDPRFTEKYKEENYDEDHYWTWAGPLKMRHGDDERNDPRKPEYWDLRKRVKSEEDIRREQEIIMQNKIKEKALIRKSLIFLLVGVFFGTIFPALFVGDGEYKEMCVCDKCMLERLRRNPSTTYMLTKDPKKNLDAVP